MNPPELSARAQVIPWGACVNEEADLFRRVDLSAGLFDENSQDVAAAQASCEACVQLRTCGQYGEEIVGRIHERLGELGVTGRIVVGGQGVAPSLAPRTDVIDDPIPFNLKRLPDDPKLALGFLRSAVRIGLLNPNSHTPPSVELLTDLVWQRLGAEKPALQGALERGTLGAERSRRGIARLVIAMFQQADYDNVVISKKSRTRYNMDRLDPEVCHEIGQQFCEDMLTLAEQRYRYPERQALVLSPEEYDRLFLKFHALMGISPAHFRDVVRTSLFQPERGLAEVWAAALSAEERHPGLSRSAYVARAVQTRKSESVPVRKAAPRRITVGAVRHIVDALVADPNAVLQPQDLPEAEWPHLHDGTADTIRALVQRFGDDPNFRTPTALLHNAHLPMEIALARCEMTQRKTADLPRQNGVNAFVPDVFVFKHFLHSPQAETSYEQLVKIYEVDRMYSKLQQRSRPAGLPYLPKWVLQNTYEWYGDEFSQAADVIYNMTIQREFLVTAKAEMSILMDVTLGESLRRLCDSYDGRHLTFDPRLSALSAGERLTFAAQLGLGRMLYGQDISKERVAAYLEVADLAVAWQELLPRIEALIAVAQAEAEQSDVLPMSPRLLSDDLLELEARLNPARVEEFPQHSPEALTTVVGGRVVHAGSDVVAIRYGTAQETAWLKQAIFTICRSRHREVAPCVQAALQDGIIELRPAADGQYEVSFSERIRNVSNELEQAALACHLQVDRFMYKQDLQNVLKIRLGEEFRPVAESILREVGKKNAFFSTVSDDTARELFKALQAQSAEGVAASVAAQNLREALLKGVLSVVPVAKRGLAPTLSVTDFGYQHTKPHALIKLIKECGASDLLAAEDAARLSGLLNTPVASAAPSEARQPSPEQAGTQFEAHIEYFMRGAPPALRRAIAFHFGLLQGRDSTGGFYRDLRAVVARSLRPTQEAYSIYVAQQPRAPLSDTQEGVDLVRLILCGTRVGRMPLPFAEAVQLASNSKDPRLLVWNQAHEQFNAGLKDFVRWLKSMEPTGEA